MNSIAAHKNEKSIECSRLRIAELGHDDGLQDDAGKQLLEATAELDARIFPSNVWGLEAYSASVANSYDVLLAAYTCAHGYAKETSAESGQPDQNRDDTRSALTVSEAFTEENDAACMHKISLAGFALLRCFDDAELIRIAVDESCRRHGIGRALLERLIAEAGTRGVSSIFLEVRSGNTPAIAMYEAAGFTREGVRKGYYSGPKEDALIMKYSC